MTEQDWHTGFAKSFGVFMNGSANQSPDDRGRPVTDEPFVLLFNAHHEAIDWLIPRAYGQGWELVLDTANLRPEPDPRPVTRRVTTRARSMVLLRANASDVRV